MRISYFSKFQNIKIIPRPWGFEKHRSSAAAAALLDKPPRKGEPSSFSALFKKGQVTSLKHTSRKKGFRKKHVVFIFFQENIQHLFNSLFVSHY